MHYVHDVKAHLPNRPSVNVRSGRQAQDSKCDNCIQLFTVSLSLSLSLSSAVEHREHGDFHLSPDCNPGHPSMCTMKFMQAKSVAMTISKMHNRKSENVCCRFKKKQLELFAMPSSIGARLPYVCVFAVCVCYAMPTFHFQWGHIVFVFIRFTAIAHCQK